MYSCGLFCQRSALHILFPPVRAVCALPPAVSRTLRGLEEKGYVERSVDKKDRRNTYISLTEKGWKKGEEVRDRMHDFGCSVMSQLKEEDVDQLVAYLDRIYEIAEKEIDTRKRQN